MSTDSTPAGPGVALSDDVVVQIAREAICRSSILSYISRGAILTGHYDSAPEIAACILGARAAAAALSTGAGQPVAFDPLKGGCPHCQWLDTNIGRVLDKKCELHQRIEDLQVDLALGQQINLDTNKLLNDICELLDIGPDDDILGMLSERLEEAATPSPVAAGEAGPVSFLYLNHRGDLGRRTVTPLGIRFGTSEWYKTPTWLLVAFDHDKQAEREFAIDRIGDRPVFVEDEAPEDRYVRDGAAPPAEPVAGLVAHKAEQARCEKENAAFHEWWVSSGHAADPTFTLTMENCAHAAWQDCASQDAERIAALEASNARLSQEFAGLDKMFGDQQNLIYELGARNEETKADRDRLREDVERKDKALAPFAAVADEYDEGESDWYEVWQDAGPERLIRSTFKLNMYRAARAALAPASEDQKGVV